MGTVRPIILVLEDAEPRVTWLFKTFPDLDIRWFTNVLGLVSCLNSLEDSGTPPSIVILDHDLGIGSSTEDLLFDNNGKNGTDAANMILPPCPVVVWSANPPAGQRMRQILVDKKVDCVYIPYRTANLPILGALISRCL